MKILKKLKTTGILVTIMAFMSLLVGDVSYPDARDDAQQRLEKGPQIMKPGYLVLDDWKDGGANAPQIKRRNDVEADLKDQIAPRDEVKAELKKKKSAQAAEVQTIDIPEGIEIPLEELDYVPQGILEYLNAREGNVVEYCVRYSSGTYRVFWRERNTSSKETLRMNIFDQNGEKVLEEDHILTGDRVLNAAYISNITTLQNGNIAIVWRESSTSNKYSLRMNIFNQNGEKLLDQVLTGNRVLNDVWISNIATLQNGNIAVTWREYNTNGKYSLRMNIFSQNGEKILEENLILTGNMVLNNAGISNIITLQNGNIAIIWQEVDASNKYSLRMNIFSQSGEKLLEENLVLTGNRVLNTAGIENITTLQNGNIAVVWWEIDRSNKYSLRMNIFSQNGEKLLEEDQVLTGDRVLSWVDPVGIITTLQNGNIAIMWRERNTSGKETLRMNIFSQSGEKLLEEDHILTGNRVLNGAEIENITTLQNGNIAIMWHENNTSNKGSLRMNTFNQSGEKILEEDLILTGGRVLNGAGIENITALQNGNIAIAWWEINPSNKYSLRMNIFSQSGEKILEKDLILTKNRVLHYIYPNIATLQNGNIAIVWWELNSDYKYSLRMNIFSQSGEKILEEDNVLTGDRVLTDASLPNITSLQNGNIAVVWHERSTSGKYSIRMNIFSQIGEKILEEDHVLTGDRVLSDVYVYIPNIVTLQNGNIAIVWREINPSNKYSLRMNMFNQNGEKLLDYDFAKDGAVTIIGAKSVIMLPNGNLAVSMSKANPENGNSFYSIKVFNQEGKEIPPDEALKGILPDTSTQYEPRTYTRDLTPQMPRYDDTGSISPQGTDSRRDLRPNLINTLRPDLGPGLSVKEGLSTDIAPKLYVNIAPTLDKDKLRNLLENALTSRGAMDIYKSLQLSDKIIDSILVRIVNNPTEEEQKLLDAATKLKEDLENENLAGPGLKQASDDFIRVVANVLLAQALPDLLTEEGLRDIRMLFDDFNKEKNEIFEIYRESINPYYENIKDELIKNRAILKVKDMLTPDMKDQDIKALGRNAVDSIIDRIRKDDTKTEKEKALLKKEAELRQQYLNPALTRLEENMRFLLQSYTHRLTLVLEGARVTNKEKLE